MMNQRQRIHTYKNDTNWCWAEEQNLKPQRAMTNTSLRQGVGWTYLHGNWNLASFASYRVMGCVNSEWPRWTYQLNETPIYIIAHEQVLSFPLSNSSSDPSTSLQLNDKLQRIELQVDNKTWKQKYT